MFLPVAFRDVFLVCILDDCIECVYSCVDVCDGCTVECCEVLFCFFYEGFPVGSFVVRICVFVANWGVSCFGGDDDWEVVRP